MGTAKPLSHLFDRGLLREAVKVYASKESMDYEQAHGFLSNLRDGVPKTPYQICKHCDHGLIQFDRRGYEMVAGCTCVLGQKWTDWKEKGGDHRIRPYTHFHSLDTARSGLGVRDTIGFFQESIPAIVPRMDLDDKGESYDDDAAYARSMRGEA